MREGKGEEKSRGSVYKGDQLGCAGRGQVTQQAKVSLKSMLRHRAIPLFMHNECTVTSRDRGWGASQCICRYCIIVSCFIMLFALYCIVLYYIVL